MGNASAFGGHFCSERLAAMNLDPRQSSRTCQMDEGARHTAETPCHSQVRVEIRAKIGVAALITCLGCRSLMLRGVTNNCRSTCHSARRMLHADSMVGIILQTMAGGPQPTSACPSLLLRRASQVGTRRPVSARPSRSRPSSEICNSTIHRAWKARGSRRFFSRLAVLVESSAGESV